MINLPEELNKLSSKELVKILDVDNIYKVKYFAYNKDNYKHFQILKLLKRYKTISIYEDLETHYIRSFNSKETSLPYQLYSRDIEKFKNFKSKNLLNTISTEAFDVYLRKIASGIFGSNKIDTSYNEDYNTLVIYFPELTITNSVETIHTMYDIYIKFEFYNKAENSVFGRGLNRIKFARTTFTDIEIASNYQFSHLNSGGFGEYSSSFCFGRTPLATAVNELKRGKLDMLATVLTSFKDYLSWESIEGTPYRHLSKMVKGERYTQKNIELDNSDKVEIYSIILKNIKDFKYNYNLINGAYKINLSKEYVEQLDSILTTKYKYLVYPLVDGVSCTENTNLNLDEFKKMQDKSTEVTFNGETKKLKVIHTIAENKNQVSKRIHRTVLNYAVETLEQNFYNYLVNKKLTEIV